MKKRLMLMFVLLLILTACAQKTPIATPTATVEATRTATKAIPPTATEIAVTETPELGSPLVTVSPTAVAGCKTAKINTEPNPTMEALFPPPGEDDWVIGPETASVTIIEYSDFQ